MWIVVSGKTVVVNTEKVDAIYIDNDNRLIAAYRGVDDTTTLFRAETLHSAKEELNKIVKALHLKQTVYEMPEDEIC